jgi:DNA-binding transcriptional LysR family regulator
VKAGKGTKEIKHLNITLNHIRTFIVVARLGSFNRAAEELSRTQPAITLAIKQLEEYMGLKLFERTTRRVTTTGEAETFMPVAERLIRDFDLAIQDMTAMAECRSGHVSLAVLPSVTTRLMPTIIEKFSRQYPNISIHLNDNTSRWVQQAVEKNEVDFGVSSLWHPNNQLSVQPIIEDQFQLVCHRNHKLGQTTGPIRWQELNGHDFIGSGITHGFKQQKYIGTPKYEMTTTTSLFAMIRAELGITVLPSLAIPDDDYLVTRPMIKPVETREISVMLRQQSILSPAATALLKMIIQEVPGLLESFGSTAKMYPLDNIRI